MAISGDQIRMARAALKWGVRDLADRAQVSPTTIAAVEADKDARSATLMVIQQALEAAGIEFIAENGGGSGVRFRKRKARRSVF